MADEQDEQQAELFRLAQLAESLVTNHEKFRSIMAAMLAARQLYHVAMYDLGLKLGELNTIDPTAPELTDEQRKVVTEVLVRSIAAEGQKPFEHLVLFKGLTETVFPWLLEVVKTHTAQQQAAAQIELGFDLQLDGGATALNRQDRVMFVGEAAVVRWLLNHIMEFLQDKPLQLLHLADRAPQIQATNLVHLPGQTWKNCARSRNSFAQLYDTTIQPLLYAPPDVMLVSDICHATSGFMPTSMADRAQMLLQQWAETKNTLLISGLQLTTPPSANELEQEKYQTLNEFNILRLVEFCKTDDPSLFEVRVGGQCVKQVPADALNPFKDKLIITGS
jgi:hypothetical protein